MVLSDATVAEVRELLADVARSQDLITYSDLASRITSADIEPHGSDMSSLLEEVSREEHGSSPRRPLLSAVVVRKSDPSRPGQGFFRLARNLGFDVRDEDAFWATQLQAVYNQWVPTN
ncbi:MAG TPA: hypothetical protein VG797_05285 [Phycisphaerales bacterium]|nr:hypothetical protein [Phycisphaerales bacterium]